VTLILSALTRDAVVQVSDRRFVYLRPDGTVHRDQDDSNKAVVFANRVAFAFTGIAQLGPMSEKTDMWMAKILNPAHDQGEAVQTLANAASERFQRPLIRRLPASFKSQEFVGVGWARFPPDRSTDEPYIVVVTNMHGKAADRFQVKVERLGGRACLIHSAGQALDQPAQAELTAAGDAFPNGPTPVLALADAMVTCVRSVADRNPMVGRGVMVTSFPRAAIEAHGAEMMMLASGPMDNVATFVTIDHDGFDAVVYGPIVASGGGGAILAGFEACSTGEDAGSSGTFPTPPKRPRRN
jgi:hypothetical protein